MDVKRRLWGVLVALLACTGFAVAAAAAEPTGAAM